MVSHMISRARGASLYEQVADALRRKIKAGELAPGDKLPSEKYLAEEYGVGRDTVRDAIAHLRKEGLIDTRRGHRTTVRKPPERELVLLRPGERVYARMPTPEECQEFAIGVEIEGVPVLVVGDTVYPADRFEFYAPE
jgi:DNA-binding FadR family transcriptional regulator